MRILTEKEKNKIYAGAAKSTLLWIGLIGASLIMSTVNSLVNTFVNASSPSYEKKSYTSSQRGSSMIKMSVIPSRSSVNFWV